MSCLSYNYWNHFLNQADLDKKLNRMTEARIQMGLIKNVTPYAMHQLVKIKNITINNWFELSHTPYG